MSVTEAPDVASGSPQAQVGGTSYFSCSGLQSFYGDSFVVQNVSFSIAEGEIVALLGRNGAGKTSTLRSIARAAQPEVRAGEIYLNGESMHDKKDYQAARAGIQLVQEDRCIVQGLTVEENLELAQINGEPGWSYERIFELFPRLGERRKQEGTTMSGGEQQMLAIARALARDVKFLLLDEPYEGLAPVIVNEIEATLQEVKRTGITAIIVEQNAVRALKLADRALILDSGELVFEGTAEQVLNDEALRHEYLAI